MLVSSPTQQGLEACEPARAVPCSPDDPCPYCTVTNCSQVRRFCGSRVFCCWRFHHPTPVACLGESRSARRMEEDRGRKRKRNSPQTARAGKTRQRTRSAPFAVHLWGLASATEPPSALPNPMRSRSEAGSRTDLRSAIAPRRVSSQTMRKNKWRSRISKKSRLQRWTFPTIPNCLRERAIMGKGGCCRGTSPFKSGDLSH